MYSVNEKEAQALALLEAIAQPEPAQMLKRCAFNIARDHDEAADLLQQSVLDAHDYVQARGYEGDVRHLVLRIMQRRHIDEQRRQCKHPLVDLAALELADASPDVDERAHLAQLVAAYVQEEFEPADRVLLRLHVEGYSLRETQQLTGRNYKAVQRVLGSMFARVREVFGPMWEGKQDQPAA